MVHARRTASRWGAFAAAGIALLLLAGAPDRAEPAPSQKAEAANQAHGADYAPSKTNAATFAPKPSDAAEHHSGGAPEQTREHPQPDPIRITDWIMAGSAAASAFFALVLAFLTWRLWVVGSNQHRAMIRSNAVSRRAVRNAVDANTISRDSLEADSRPWVEVEVTLQEFAFIPSGANMKIEFRMRNLGKSPALKVWPEFFFVPHGKVEDTRKLISLRAKEHSADRTIGRTLFPKASWTPWTIGSSITIDTMEEISAKLGDSGAIPVQLVGSMIYLSPNGTPHETGFLFDLMKIKNEPGAHPLILFRGEDLTAYHVFLMETPMYSPIT